ncbi:response regulator [Azospirillum sp. TSH7]|uniref:response regulator transcription factor n=1 Tax=unclassified Azospirillum TaxID=2630922 RepID=UPI000D61097E|nr:MULTISPECIES: response regulator transcription factor [unclassified Azospirillum]PWC57605.1 response regulator [Azospirillum sp. TSH7]PWC67387.1 response regulator [Azospirillum sp. TSH20]
MTEPTIARIALVDDDDLFRESLSLNLGDEGYEVITFDRGEPALDFFAEGGSVDIVLLDWRMPKLDGIDVLRQMRARGIATPVIFLTVLSDQIYEEAALAGGALDFVEKSRSLSILLKRMRLILDGIKGDATKGAEDAEAGGNSTSHRLGELELRLDNSRAFWKGKRIDLTLTEFNIVKLMSTRPEEDVSYREIYDLVHGKGFVAGYGPSGYRANVRAFIKRIRQKFRSVDATFACIENYPGFGYRWGKGENAANQGRDEDGIGEDMLIDGAAAD